MDGLAPFSRFSVSPMSSPILSPVQTRPVSPTQPDVFSLNPVEEALLALEGKIEESFSLLDDLPRKEQDMHLFDFRCRFLTEDQQKVATPREIRSVRKFGHVLGLELNTPIWEDRLLQSKLGSCSLSVANADEQCSSVDIVETHAKEHGHTVSQPESPCKGPMVTAFPKNKREPLTDEGAQVLQAGPNEHQKKHIKTIELPPVVSYTHALPSSMEIFRLCLCRKNCCSEKTVREMVYDNVI